MHHLSDHFQGPLGAVVLSLIAFSVVFLVLMALMLLLIGVKHLAGLVDAVKAAKEAQAQAVKASKAPSSPKEAPRAVARVQESGDQLIAVLTAAIAAGGLENFRISSVRPAVAVADSLTSGWKRLSRLDNLEGWE